MKKYTVAILGCNRRRGTGDEEASGGAELPGGEAEASGQHPERRKTVMFRGQNIPIEEANEAAFQGVDLVLGRRKMKSPYALLRPSGLQELCLWTIPAPSVWTPPSPWWCRRSIPGCRSSYRDCGQSQLLHHHHRDRHRRAQPAFTHPSMVASTYQAVSGAGVAGIGELHDQISALEAGERPLFRHSPIRLRII